MLSYCFKCRKNTKSKNPRVEKTKRGKLMLFKRKCAVCGSKRVRFNKEQEASGLLLGLNSSLKIFHYWGLFFKDTN